MALDIRSVPEVKPSSSYDYTTKHASNSQGPAQFYFYFFVG